MLAGVFEAIWEVFSQHSDPVWAGGSIQSLQSLLLLYPLRERARVAILKMAAPIDVFRFDVASK